MLSFHTGLETVEPTPRWPPTEVPTERPGVTYARCWTQLISVAG